MLLLLIIIPLIPQLQRSYLCVFQCFSLPLSRTQTFLKPFSNQFQSPKTVLPWLLLVRMSRWFFFFIFFSFFSFFLSNKLSVISLSLPNMLLCPFSSAWLPQRQDVAWWHKWVDTKQKSFSLCQRTRAHRKRSLSRKTKLGLQSHTYQACGEEAFPKLSCTGRKLLLIPQYRKSQINDDPATW